ncbi:MAG: hypothetical protein WC813_04190 [Patescibacteria group bacterium]|jgi:hypothetical protein
MQDEIKDKKEELKEAVTEIKAGIASWIFSAVQGMPTWALALMLVASTTLTLAQDAAESVPGLVYLVKLVDVPLVFIDGAIIDGAGLLAALELVRRAQKVEWVAHAKAIASRIGACAQRLYRRLRRLPEPEVVHSDVPAPVKE